MANLTLLAPLSGWCAPLDETPDAVFAQRLLGDGLAIDPTDGVLHAPCDGEVISVAAAGHAIALRASNGADILLHVGIDTVGLPAQASRCWWRRAHASAAGEPLPNSISTTLAQRAKSLITPMVMTGERISIANACSGKPSRPATRCLRCGRRAASRRSGATNLRRRKPPTE